MRAYKADTKQGPSSADDLLPVKNLPHNRGYLRPPQYAERAFELLAPGIGMQKYQKIRGQNQEDFGTSLLSKQRKYKPACLTQDQIASTPGYRSKDLTSGRNLDAH